MSKQYPPRLRFSRTSNSFYRKRETDTARAFYKHKNALKNLCLATLVFVLPAFLNAQTSYEKKTVVQGFWWDYWNNNFPNGWANYLTEIAPRLRDMGVDAVWIPPTIKNQDFGSKGVGYAPYDHYDLGDKMQKNDATTRVGTKDELLRMIAVLHANGIEVIQDIVPNHVIGAGSDTGGGGQDPAAPSAACTDTWKNFRYACYKTPATDQSETEYLAREGRFPKNHQNYHPNPDHGCNQGLCDPNSDPICWQGFGPDVCYWDGAWGTSSNAAYNPDQSTYSPYGNGGIGTNNGYMRKHTREWLVWYKKQTGFDGVRVDAVKHFPSFVSEDFLYNMQQEAGWANGGDEMFAVGEWVGDAAALDAWVTAVDERSGTFDFSLRAFSSNSSLYDMIYGNGAFDMGNLPGAQQNIRYIDINNVRIHRTVPFVNNHDTYRPQTDSVGNITGWNTGDELSPHVDIREPRMAAAYAVACAMDGNPQIFFEDLFNIANTSKRFSHQPTNTTDLPANQDIANIMLAHGALNFKEGDYAVPSNIATFYNNLTNDANNDDILVIARKEKAIIGVTDSWDTDQDVWVDTDFGLGTRLVDYSGGFADTVEVLGPAGGGTSNRVNIKTRAVGYPDFTYSASYADHGAHYHGYSIWAPIGQNLNSYVNAAIPTTQEWEMEDDLGDSHCESLGQGGRVPDNSYKDRVVGKIFVAKDSAITYEVILTTPANSLIVDFYDLDGNLLHADTSSASVMTGSFTQSAIKWVTIKVRNLNNTYAGQKCYVKMTYAAPANVTTSSFPTATTVSIWTGNADTDDWDDCRNWEEGLVPACTSTVIIPHQVDTMPSIDTCFTGTFINRGGLSLRPKVFLQGPYDSGTGLMADDLRTSGVIPTMTPYGGTDTVAAEVLAETGNDAIVDWVKLELRDKDTPATILETHSALLQRDGDIVGTDGVSPVFFNGMVTDEYYIAIRHRNHLGAMTASAITLGNTIIEHDFTDNTNTNWGTNAQKDLGSSVMGLWSGNTNEDNKVVYSGADTDINPISFDVLNNPGNPLNFPFLPLSGYSLSDVNMDGKTVYSGADTDVNPVSSNVLNHPNNPLSFAFYVITEQLP
ncbi:MAG: alpha-amylase family glycosyl hydrolase [Bacteroidota bacterium]